MQGKSIGFVAAFILPMVLAASQLLALSPSRANSLADSEPPGTYLIAASHLSPRHPTHTVKQSPASTAVCIVDSKLGQQLNLPIYEWLDNTKSHKGTIVAVPGMTLYAFAWNDMAKYLASNGYVVFSLDQRGFGRWRTEAAKFGGDNKIQIGQSQQDLLDVMTDLRQAHPKEKIFLLGESLGSNMALALIAEHPDLANAAILGSPCYKTRMHAKPLRWAADFAKTIVKPNRFINLEPYSAPYLTNDAALARACDSDPMIYRKISAAELIKIDVMNDRAIEAAKKLPPDFPLLIIAGAKDAMFKSTELPKAIEKFGTHDVQLHLLAGKGHLLMEHQPVQPVIGSIIDTWLNQQVNSGTSLVASPASQKSVSTGPGARSTTHTGRRVHLPAAGQKPHSTP